MQEIKVKGRKAKPGKKFLADDELEMRKKGSGCDCGCACIGDGHENVDLDGGYSGGRADPPGCMCSCGGDVDVDQVCDIVYE